MQTPVRGASNKMNGKPRRLVLILLLVLCGAAATNPEQTAPVTGNRLRFAQDFLRTFYPDLSGKKYALTVDASTVLDQDWDNISHFNAYIGKYPKWLALCCTGGYVGEKPPPGYQEGVNYPEQFLTSGFRFDARGRLESFGAHGPAVGDLEAANKFAEIVLSHPEMTDAQVTAELKKAGAKYGPEDREAFIKNLPIGKLERFLGKLEVTSMGFRPPMENRNDIAIWPYWTVTVKAKQRDGSHLTYELHFEQFKGDLTGLAAVPYPRETGPKK